MSNVEQAAILDKLEDIQNAVQSLHTIQYVNGDGMTHSVSRDEFFQNQYDTDKKIIRRVSQLERDNESNLTPKRIVALAKDAGVVLTLIYLLFDKLL